MGVDGHRADLTILKGAMAHAAFNHRTRISEVDILVAAQLALPHRLKRRPLQNMEREMQALSERLEKALQEAEARNLDADAQDGPGEVDKKKVRT